MKHVIAIAGGIVLGTLASTLFEGHIVAQCVIASVVSFATTLGILEAL